MNHRLLGLLGLLFVFSACTKSPEIVEGSARKTYLESQLTPQELFLHAEQYIQWVLGYNLQVREESRGIMVTDWVMDDPQLRHQLTIRVNQGAQSPSLLTAHFVVQERLPNNEWNELPSGGYPEEDFVVELEEQVRRVETERFQSP
jgi:hypothetical protein